MPVRRTKAISMAFERFIWSPLFGKALHEFHILATSSGCPAIPCYPACPARNSPTSSNAQNAFREDQSRRPCAARYRFSEGIWTWNFLPMRTARMPPLSIQDSMVLRESPVISAVCAVPANRASRSRFVRSRYRLNSSSPCGPLLSVVKTP